MVFLKGQEKESYMFYYFDRVPVEKYVVSGDGNILCSKKLNLIFKVLNVLLLC
jgi:hypothetical protein